MFKIIQTDAKEAQMRMRPNLGQLKSEMSTERILYLIIFALQICTQETGKYCKVGGLENEKIKC